MIDLFAEMKIIKKLLELVLLLFYATGYILIEVISAPFDQWLKAITEKDSEKIGFIMPVLLSGIVFWADVYIMFFR